MFTVKLIIATKVFRTYANCSSASYDSETDILTFTDEDGREHRTNLLFEIVKELQNEKE